MLRRVDLSKLKVDDRLEQLNNGASKVSLHREANGRAIFNLNVEACDGFAALLTADLNLEVDTVG